MKDYKLTESEEKFAELIWQNEPIGSGELVKVYSKLGSHRDVALLFCHKAYY